MKRTCNKCKIEKEDGEFYKKYGNRKGLRTICKECHSKERKNWYQINKSTVLTKQGTPEYRKRSFEIYKIRRANNPFPIRAMGWRNTMKVRSKKNNLKYDIDFFTINYLVNLQKTQTKCDCCNVKLDFAFNGDGIRVDSNPSLDRINPQKGYTKDNVAMICWRCNRLKFDGFSNELQIICNWMKSHGV